MKKNFKNTVNISSGFPEMITAFTVWAESIGWGKYPYTDPKGRYITLHSADCGNVKKMNYIQHDGFTQPNPKVFQLPAQWSEAMQAASAVEIVWEKGDKIWTGNEVREVSDTNGSILYLVGGNFVYATDIRPATPEEIEAASEVRPEFENGDLVQIGNTIVLCFGSISKDRFRGVVLKTDNCLWYRGYNPDSWDKVNFTTCTEPFTLHP